MSVQTPRDAHVIETSWRRSLFYGAQPSMEISTLPRLEIDRHSKLMAAAGPVLDDLAEDLTGERFGVILTDHKARIVDRRVGSARFGDALDGISAVPGADYSEEVVGTNALGTACELGIPISVIGDEHFNNGLKDFSCYGAPIRNPVAGRLAGSIDVCGPDAENVRMFRPLIRAAIRHIERRLVATSSQTDQQLLMAYHAAAGQTDVAVVALSDSVTLSNGIALDVLQPADFAVLQEAHQTVTTRQRRWVTDLSGGHTVEIQANQVMGGTLFTIRPGHPRSGARIAIAHKTLPAVKTAPAVARLAFVGEPGSGRTELAASHFGVSRQRCIDAAHFVDAASWADRLRAMHTVNTTEAIVISNVDLLSDAKAKATVEFLTTHPTVDIAMTSASESEVGPRQAQLLSLCDTTQYVRPLRERRDEIPAIVAAILANSGEDQRSQFTRSAMSKLLQYLWPGNVSELKTVLTQIATSGGAGPITVAQLPLRIVDYHPPRLSRIEQAERLAIVEALRRTNGNKTRAASDLGISRRNLYNKIRQLQIV